MANQEIVEIEFKGKGDLLEQIKKLDIATKSLLNTQVKLVIQGKSVQTNMSKNARAYKKAINNTKTLEKETKKLNQRTRILGGTFAVLRSKLLIFNFVMGLGVRQIKRFGGTASEVESVSTAFNTLTDSTNSTFSSLRQLQQATNNTVSDFDLLKQANNALVLGVTDNIDEMSKMFDIAQRLGRALGRDTATSVESLITGIGRQSRLMLDNIGIIVKSEEAYEAYAEANNKLVKNLTDAEKKQAFFNATMESAKTKVGSLGTEVLSTQDIFDQFKVALFNLAVSIGGVVAKMSPLVENMTNSANSASRFFKSLTETSLETTIRELRDLGVETKSLMQLQQIQLERNIIKLNKELGANKDFYTDINILQNKINSNTEETIKHANQATKSQIQLEKLVNDENVARLEMTRIQETMNNMQSQGAIARNQSSIEHFQFLEKELKKQTDIFFQSTKEQQILKEKIQTSEIALDLLSKEGKTLEENLKIQSDLKATEAELLALKKTKTDAPTTEDGVTTPSLNETELRNIESLRRTVLGESFEFQMNQLAILEKEFNEKVGATVVSEQYFADERDRIREEGEKKRQELADKEFLGTKELAQKKEEARKLIRGESVNFQLEQLTNLQQELEGLVGKELDVTTFIEEQKQKIREEFNQEQLEIIKKQEDARKVVRNDAMQDQLDDLTTLQGELEAILGSEIDVATYIEEEKKKVRDEFNQKRIDQEMDFFKLQVDNTNLIIQEAGKALDQFNKNTQQRKDNEIKALKTTEKFRNASATQRENMENAIRENFAKEEERLFAFKKMQSIASVVMNIAEQTAKYAGNPLMSAFIAGVGSLQLGAIMAQKPPKYATGGLVGGKRHSQGGTLIEAEQGEFVMSRQAVQSAGLEAMNEINQGNTGGTNITLNISAPLVDETVVDQIIPAINTALQEDKARLSV